MFFLSKLSFHIHVTFFVFKIMFFYYHHILLKKLIIIKTIKNLMGLIKARKKCVFLIKNFIFLFMYISLFYEKIFFIEAMSF
jgi:hypothetical protein